MFKNRCRAATWLLALPLYASGLSAAGAAAPPMLQADGSVSVPEQVYPLLAATQDDRSDTL